MLTVTDLEVLCARILNLFEEQTKVTLSISIRLPSESLSFENLSELKEYQHLPASVSSFTILFLQGEKTVTVRSGRHLAIRPSVTARSDSEAWSAGAVETVYSFLRSHQLWYNWFVSAPLGWIVFLAGNFPMLILAFKPNDKIISTTELLGWFGAFLVLSLLYFGRERLLPSGVIKISNKDSFYKKHNAELTLVIAVIGLILTAIGLFIAH
jgi:hypothetical protein